MNYWSRYQISEKDGFALSIPIIASLYLFTWGIYYWRHEVVMPFDTWQQAHLLGIILHLMFVIPAGKTARLMFYGNDTGREWTWSVCMTPNILLFTLDVFKTGLLYSVQVKYSALEIKERAIENAPLFDQRVPLLTSSSILGKIWVTIWFFLVGWMRLEPHMRLSQLGFRIMVITFIGMNISPIASKATEKVVGTVFELSNFFNKSFNISPSKEAVITATAHLLMAPLPKMPAKEDFEYRSKNGEPSYFMVNGDDRRYYHYVVPKDGGVPKYRVHTNMCALIPFGKKIFFAGMYKPTVDINMTPFVAYEKRWETTSIRERLGFIRDHGWDNLRRGLSVTTSWQVTYQLFYEIDLERGYIVEAKQEGEVKKGNNGSLVCF